MGLRMGPYPLHQGGHIHHIPPPLPSYPPLRRPLLLEVRTHVFSNPPPTRYTCTACRPFWNAGTKIQWGFCIQSDGIDFHMSSVIFNDNRSARILIFIERIRLTKNWHKCMKVLCINVERFFKRFKSWWKFHLDAEGMLCYEYISIYCVVV